MKNRIPSPLPAQDPLQQLRNELACSQAELRRTRIELQHAHSSEQQARHQALHDSLTELPNRSCFRQRLDRDLARGQPLTQASAPVLAVLYLDLDGFKPINDRHGHETGDGLLRVVAARLARAVRSDDMVCRVGGDEFVCLLGDVLNRQQLSHLACKLFDAVSAPLRIGALDLLVRPSIGIAVCPQDGDTTDALLRRADTAMYRAKRQQLGYAFFDAAIDG
jgi:diguanylate cyclase (GGDEF)-like protein